MLKKNISNIFFGSRLPTPRSIFWRPKDHFEAKKITFRPKRSFWSIFFGKRWIGIIFFGTRMIFSGAHVADHGMIFFMIRWSFLSWPFPLGMIFWRCARWWTNHPFQYLAFVPIEKDKRTWQGGEAGLLPPRAKCGRDHPELFFSPSKRHARSSHSDKPQLHNVTR